MRTGSPEGSSTGGRVADGAVTKRSHMKNNALHIRTVAAGLLCIMCRYAVSVAVNIPYFPVDTTGNEYARFVAYVDRALAGNPDYGFSPFDAMIRYGMCGNTKYADFAIAQVDAEVASEEAAVAAGNAPDVAGDSYLYVGEQIASLSLTYDWAFSRLTESQKTRWKVFADQTIYNVWNPSAAKWGGTSKPWSGW